MICFKQKYGEWQVDDGANLYRDRYCTSLDEINAMIDPLIFFHWEEERFYQRRIKNPELVGFVAVEDEVVERDRMRQRTITYCSKNHCRFVEYKKE